MISCNEEKVDRNPFLQEISFDERINLSLPTFDNLRYQGGSVYWQNGGIKGLNLFNLYYGLGGKLSEPRPQSMFSNID